MFLVRVFKKEEDAGAFYFLFSIIIMNIKHLQHVTQFHSTVESYHFWNQFVDGTIYGKA